MNNIEILEERINFCKNNTECREELNQCFGCTFEIEEIQAIENLIQEYKELKEENEELLEIKVSTNVHNIIDELERENARLRAMTTDIFKNYIPKSKVKEKIEEIEKRKQDLLQLPDDCARTLGLEDCDEKIILYKELLEGE